MINRKIVSYLIATTVLCLMADWGMAQESEESVKKLLQKKMSSSPSSDSMAVSLESPAKVAAEVGILIYKAELTGAASTTRGNTEAYTVITIPSGLNSTFNWKFTGSGKTIQESTVRNNIWAGVMVVSGTIEVATVVGNTQCKNILNVTVNARSWDENYPTGVQDGGEGILAIHPYPRSTYELGKTFFRDDATNNFKNYRILTQLAMQVAGGPNKGWNFTLLEPVTFIPVKAYHNGALYDSNNPFYKAQDGSEGEQKIEATQEDVRVHEGIDQKSGFDSHWSLGEAYLKNNPINVPIEKDVSYNTDESIVSYGKRIDDKVTNSLNGFKAAAIDTHPKNVNSKNPDTDIDFSYPVIQPRNWTLSVGKDIQLNESGGTAPIIWTSSNANVATVDNKGKVKGVSVGLVQIKAADKNSDSDQVTVTVTP